MHRLPDGSIPLLYPGQGLPHPLLDRYADFTSALITTPHIHIVLGLGVGCSHMAVRALIDHDSLAGHDQQGKVSRVRDHLGVPPILHQTPERLEFGVAYVDGPLEFVQAGKAPPAIRCRNHRPRRLCTEKPVLNNFAQLLHKNRTPNPPQAAFNLGFCASPRTTPSNNGASPAKSGITPRILITSKCEGAYPSGQDTPSNRLRPHRPISQDFKGPLAPRAAPANTLALEGNWYTCGERQLALQVQG